MHGVWGVDRAIENNKKYFESAHNTCLGWKETDRILAIFQFCRKTLKSVKYNVVCAMEWVGATKNVDLLRSSEKSRNFENNSQVVNQ